MEAADADLDAGVAQRLGDVEGTRELVRLHAHQHHHAGARILDHARDLRGLHPRVGLVDSAYFEFDVVAQHLALGAVAREAVERRQRVRGDGRQRPLDDVAVVVVMRRLHQNQAELLARCAHGNRPPRRCLYDVNIPLRLRQAPPLLLRPGIKWAARRASWRAQSETPYGYDEIMEPPCVADGNGCDRRVRGRWWSRGRETCRSGGDETDSGCRADWRERDADRLRGAMGDSEQRG